MGGWGADVCTHRLNDFRFPSGGDLFERSGSASWLGERAISNPAIMHFRGGKWGPTPLMGVVSTHEQELIHF